MDPEAFSWFQTVDADRSGYISVKELKQALVNSNWSAFNDETCLMMISEFRCFLSRRCSLLSLAGLLFNVEKTKSWLCFCPNLCVFAPCKVNPKSTV